MTTTMKRPMIRASDPLVIAPNCNECHQPMGEYAGYAVCKMDCCPRSGMVTNVYVGKEKVDLFRTRRFSRPIQRLSPEEVRGLRSLSTNNVSGWTYTYLVRFLIVFFVALLIFGVIFF